MSKFISFLLAIIITATAVAISSGKTATNTPAEKRINSLDETEHFEKLYPFNANGSIDLGNINGSIVIEAWDSPQIKFEYDKVAGSRERLADVEVQIEAGQDSFRVKTDYSNQKKGNWNWDDGGKLYVNFRLTVPRTAVLDKVRSVNGDITLADMTNAVNVSAVNGNIMARNLSGALKISTVNGKVNAELTQVMTGSEIKLSTVNGTVNLFLPNYVDAAFDGSTVNGSITSDFGLTVTKKKYGSGSSLSGTLGSGSSKIRLSSVNGTIAVKQGRAVNL
ncbi:MAG: DUF4097 family beta strand repeat-containing protein [Pyrinomonadaceae bacterium]